MTPTGIYAPRCFFWPKVVIVKFMRVDTSLLFLCGLAVVIMTGLFAVPFVFAGKVMPGIFVADYQLGGTALADLPGVLAWYGQNLQARQVQITLRGETARYKLSDLALELDTQAIAQNVQKATGNELVPNVIRVAPVFSNHDVATREALEHDFAQRMSLPRNADLQITPAGQVVIMPGRAGEKIDVVQLRSDVARAITIQTSVPNFSLLTTTAPPEIQDGEVASAKAQAETLIRNGFQLHYTDQIFTIQPFTLKRLLTFQPKPDDKNKDNNVLGVAINPQGFSEYVGKTIEPQVKQEAVNARFEVVQGEAGELPKVSQFTLPQTGRSVDIPATTAGVLQALEAGQNQAEVVIATIEPDMQGVAGITALGIQKLLTTGVTDFKGSPKNRIHNIEVGATRYHGVLIPPNAEFSFLSFLGPVDGEHGFKPELVIKNNVTTPEFGGGLCQVSTTAFRSAVQAGLKITERHNHAYAVHYYGTPGFDATIYPPYTDLRFLNNTPGYILIQTRVEGTKLIFEFWGSDDGRSVALTGPSPYGRQANGAVKSTLVEKVTTADGTTLFEDTFRSNYKSPSLYPKVLGATNELTPTNEPTPTPSPTATPNPTPPN